MAADDHTGDSVSKERRLRASRCLFTLTLRALQSLHDSCGRFDFSRRRIVDWSCVADRSEAEDEDPTDSVLGIVIICHRTYSGRLKPGPRKVPSTLDQKCVHEHREDIRSKGEKVGYSV